MEYLWNMQGRLHKIFCKIFTDYSDEIFYGIFRPSFINLPHLRRNTIVRKYSRNIPAEDFERILKKLYNKMFTEILIEYLRNIPVKTVHNFWNIPPENSRNMVVIFHQLFRESLNYYFKEIFYRIFQPSSINLPHLRRDTIFRKYS